MKRQDLTLWENITFKTQGYRKNFDFINNNEKFITEYEGTISELRISEKMPPRPIGEYSFSVWNIGLGTKFNVDFNKLIEQHSSDNIYQEFMKLIDIGDVDVQKYKKVVFVHSIVLNKDYRKRGISEEFVEMLYNDFYCNDVAIILLAKPYQDNAENREYFKHKKVLVKKSLKPSDAHGVSATEYYSLDELLKNDDTELNEYKLFAVANRCGFQRLNESHLFLLTHEKVVERMVRKQKMLQQTETE